MSEAIQPIAGVYPDIGGFGALITPCGSRVTCNPPPDGTDRDWLVLVDADKFCELASFLEDAGWALGGSRIPENENNAATDHRFSSWVLGDDNLIITTSLVFHERFLLATYVAKQLNLLVKGQRICLFQSILYGNRWNPETDAPELADDFPPELFE